MIFEHLSKEFDSNVISIYPYEYMSGFEKFKENLASKERFSSPWTNTKF